MTIDAVSGGVVAGERHGIMDVRDPGESQCLLFPGFVPKSIITACTLRPLLQYFTPIRQTIEPRSSRWPAMRPLVAGPTAYEQLATSADLSQPS